MILVDTSVWVDHLRKGVPALAAALEQGTVLMHPFVIGELACGKLKNRSEVLQLLASITRERKVEGKAAISGKIGIGMKSVPIYEDSGMPQGVKEVTDIARRICTVSPVWRVIVSSDVYAIVKDYVEARELKLGNDSYYSIVGVEEGVI